MSEKSGTARLGTYSKRKTSKGLKDFYLKAKANIWP